MLLQPRDIIIICGLKKALRERHQQWLAGDGAFVATVSLVEVVAVLVLAVVLFGESLKQSSQCDAAAASWWYPQSMLAPVTCYIKDNISVRPCIAVLRLGHTLRRWWCRTCSTGSSSLCWRCGTRMAPLLSPSHCCCLWCLGVTYSHASCLCCTRWHSTA